MGDCSRGNSHDETWTIIPREGPKKRQFFVPRDVLCTSGIIKGWIEEPDSRPAFVKEGTISFDSCDTEVVDMVIKYLKQEHSGNKFEFPSTDLDAVFFVKVYKLAGSLGLENLRIETFRRIRLGTRSTDDFIEVAVWAQRGLLIEGERFGRWFATYVNHHHEELLQSPALESKIRNGGEDAVKLCASFLSAVAFTKEDHDRQLSLATQKYESQNSSQSFGRSVTSPSSSPVKSRDDLGLNPRKRARKAFVEDAEE